jgi:hypothetical protein
VTVDGTALARSLILNGSDLWLGGSLTLGASLTLNSFPVNNSEVTLRGGSLSAQSIVSDNGAYGYISGYGTVSGAVTGLVEIIASGGILKVDGSLADDQGYFGINSGTLELQSASSRGVDIGSNAILKLDAPMAFTGQIENINTGDTIDLGSRLIKSTIQGRLQDIRRRDSCVPICHSGWRCA